MEGRQHSSLHPSKENQMHTKSDRERQMSYDITYMYNQKNDTNELIYETEIDSQMWKTDLWLPKRKSRG